MIEFINQTAKARGTDYSGNYYLSISSLIVAAFPLGGIVGSLLGAYLSNKLGRKKALFVFSVPTLLGSCLMLLSKTIGSYESIIIGRLLIGISCGAYTGIAPMMLSEYSPQKIKGAAGILNQLVIVIAVLLAQVFGLPQLLGNPQNWPILLGLSIVPCLVQLLTLPLCPESPRYLMINKRNPNAAKQALRWLRGVNYPDIEIEIREMETENELSVSTNSSSSLKEMFQLRYLRFALFVAILCHLSQQLSGINAIINYSTILFKSAGLSNANAQYATLGTGCMNLLVTIVSIFLIERFGRRPLHLSGLSGMLVTAILFLVCLLLRHRYSVTVYGALVCVYLFIGFFAIGPGSIPWFIVAELFTQENRDVALAISVLVNWLMQILVVLVYPQLLNSIGDWSFSPFIVLLVIMLALLFKY
ncbi:Solute carrier 2, facilitated glucose transporter member 2, partial [Cichlidogyrus casuarinus]